MSLSRKRQKELNRLRASAADLWSAQQEIMERANAIAREAGKQVSHYTREEVNPRFRKTIDTRVRPRVDQGMAFGRNTAQGVGRRINRNVIPAVGTAIGTALSVADVAKDARVRAAVNRLSQKSGVAKKSGPGAGTFIAMGAGLTLLAGIGYAVWQTFRADDELWVADSEPDVPVGE